MSLAQRWRNVVHLMPTVSQLSDHISTIFQPYFNVVPKLSCYLGLWYIFAQAVSTVFTLNIWTHQLLAIPLLKLDIYNLLLEAVSKNAGLVENSVDADGAPHSAETHMGLHYLIRPVYPNTYGKYTKLLDWWKTG